MVDKLKFVWPTASLTSGNGSLSVTVRSGTTEVTTSLPGDPFAVTDVPLPTGNLLDFIFHLDDFNYPTLKVEYMPGTGNIAFKEGEGWSSYEANDKTYFCFEPEPGEDDLIFNAIPSLELGDGNEGIILVGTLDDIRPPSL